MLAFLSLSLALRNSHISTVSLLLLFLISTFLHFLLLNKYPHPTHCDFLQWLIDSHLGQVLCNAIPAMKIESTTELQKSAL